jgi:hypothetical protein
VTNITPRKADTRRRNVASASRCPGTVSILVIKPYIWAPVPVRSSYCENSGVCSQFLSEKSPDPFFAAKPVYVLEIRQSFEVRRDQECQ